MANVLYTILTLTDGSGHQIIVRNTDGNNIPEDPNSQPYQEYLAWVAEGNTPTISAGT